MVWKISSKIKNPTKEDIKASALNGVYMIAGLSVLAWIIQRLN